MMFDIPIELFIFGISLSLIFVVLGLMKNSKGYRSHWMINASGLFIAIFALSTNMIIMGYAETEKTITTYDAELPYNITSHSSSATVINATGGSEIRAERITDDSILVNQIIDCIIIDLSITGNPASTVFAGVFNEDGDLIEQFGNISTSSLTTSFITHVFCNDFSYKISSGDLIGVSSTGGSAGNLVNIRVDTNNPFDGTNTQLDSFVNDAWIDATPSTDIKMILSYNVDKITETNIIEPIDYEFTELVRTVFVLIGGFVCISSVFLMRSED